MDRDAAPTFPGHRAVTDSSRGAKRGPSDPKPGASDRARRRRLAGQRQLRGLLVLVWRHPDTRPLIPRLEKLGCAVSWCDSLEEALRLSETVAPDLVLASAGEPGEDLTGQLKLLRHAMPGPALVLVSTEVSVALRVRCQDLKAQYFAARPIAEPELRAILQLALDRRDARARR